MPVVPLARRNRVAAVRDTRYERFTSSLSSDLSSTPPTKTSGSRLQMPQWRRLPIIRHDVSHSAMNLRTSWSCEGRGASNHRRCSSSSPASHAGASFVASGLSITTPSVIEGARVWSSTTSVSPHDMSHVASMVRVWLLHQRQHQARTADSCSRALSRSSSPSTRTWNRESSWPSAPAPALHRELPPGQGEGQSGGQIERARRSH